MPEDMPDRMPKDMPDRMPTDMPDRMPEGMPDRMPEDMSDRMPEDLPVTKRINVMVGITRSKVIWFLSEVGAITAKIQAKEFASNTRKNLSICREPVSWEVFWWIMPSITCNNKHGSVPKNHQKTCVLTLRYWKSNHAAGQFLLVQ